MKKQFIYISIFLTAVLISSCSITKPRLSYSGTTYNSVSDDMLLAKSSNAAIKRLVDNITPGKKLLVIQVVDNDINDYLCDRIYEELMLRKFIAAKANQNDLKTMNTEIFDEFLIVYPVVYGTETALTQPSMIAKGVAYGLSLVSFGLGSLLLENYNYVERQSGVALHARLVDAKTGNIKWVEDFLEMDKLRLEGGLLDGIAY